MFVDQRELTDSERSYLARHNIDASRIRMTEFGCPTCWPDDPEAAWEARAELSECSRIIDEPHLIVRTLQCGNCRQHFLLIMTEIIDWAEGDDPQHWVSIPLAVSESAALKDSGMRVLDATLEALSKDRRSLHRDAPKGGNPSSYWGRGITILPQD